ncbi:hypothetical protein DPEC_G00342290 [Dallia pectoralis]|uniref:Uncharacterized protein n=1 Tax=Dallia pectoralis TaxID=75939 RepID=A0ACC2F604_DALPE|nr:hypothetical protein DPEC_G00342290 [Dallia pectoralis]
MADQQGVGELGEKKSRTESWTRKKATIQAETMKLEREVEHQSNSARYVSPPGNATHCFRVLPEPGECNLGGWCRPEDIKAKSLVSALDMCLAYCIKLLDEGCPSAEAEHVVLEPVDDLRIVVFEMLKKKEEQQGQFPIALEDEDDRSRP